MSLLMDSGISSGVVITACYMYLIATQLFSRRRRYRYDLAFFFIPMLGMLTYRIVALEGRLAEIGGNANYGVSDHQPANPVLHFPGAKHDREHSKHVSGGGE